MSTSKKQTYRVVGTAAILGHGPGEEFDATPAEAEFGVTIGALEPVEPKKAKKDERRRP